MIMSILIGLAWSIGTLIAAAVGFGVADKRKELDGFAVGFVLALVGPLTFVAAAIWSIYRCVGLLIALARTAIKPKNPREKAST